MLTIMPCYGFVRFCTILKAQYHTRFARRREEMRKKQRELHYSEHSTLEIIWSRSSRFRDLPTVMSWRFALSRLLDFS